MPDFGFDPDRVLQGLRRLASDAPAQIAGGVGRLVRETSPERLEQIMRSPARRPLIDGIFWQMPRQLDPEQAAAVSLLIRWQITGGPNDTVDTFDLHVANGRARTSRDRDPAPPRLTITMDGVELLRLVSGNSDPMGAYFKGRIMLTGDIMVAAKMAQMFRMPGGADPESAPGDPGNGPT
jgi:putative sterol carrier protein